MKALLIDGLNLVRRIFSAVPAAHDPSAHHDSVVQSVLASLLRALTYHRPTHAVGVFDGEGQNWRHQIYPRYKSQRPPMPEALRTSLPAIIAAIEHFGVNCLLYPGYEADDLLASIALKVASRGADVVILSTDASLCQMLRPGVAVHDHFTGQLLDETFVRQRFNVAPSQLVDLLALVGIRSSSIPGVKGIGLKTASRLIVEHGDLDSVLAAAEHIPGRTGQLLTDGRADAHLSRRLVSAAVDVKLGVSLSQFRVPVCGQSDVSVSYRPGGQ